MAQQTIYKSPIVLNQITHRTLKVAPLTDYNFARQLNSVLVTGHEILEVAKHYPMVFVSGSNNDIVPLAILGLTNDENLFVEDDGRWKEGAYIPAFIRRYPFILAENDASGQNFAVSVDAACEGYDKEDGISLFDEEGNPSEQLNKITEFLKQNQLQSMFTQEYINKLSSYDLLKDFTADITLPEGEKLGFSGMKMVNEKALIALDDEKALDLFRRGFMGWIYGHLHSLSNFRALGAIKAKKVSMADA